MSQVGTTPEGAPIILLKEGTSQSRGRDAQRNNIRAAKLIAEIIQTSLGPRGMDKMLVDSIGDITITNDGATIRFWPKCSRKLPLGAAIPIPETVSATGRTVHSTPLDRDWIWNPPI